MTNEFTGARCAQCGRSLEDTDEFGESQLYSPDVEFELCLPCWEEEDVLVESSGSNDHPERLAHYRKMLESERS